MGKECQTCNGSGFVRVPSKPEVPATELCDYCDEYHEGLVNYPHMDPTRPLRRTTDLEEEEMDRAAYARHDRRLFG
jgi:hypothetical protein